MRITYTLLDSDKHIYHYETSDNREGKCILPSSIYFNILMNSNNDMCGIVPYIVFLDDNINTLDYLFFYLSSSDDLTFRQDLYNKFSRVVPCYKPYYNQGDVYSLDLDISVTNFVINWNSNIFGFPVIGDDFDDKGLYPELLDNSQQRADAVSYILNPDPQKELDPVIWDDTYLKFCQFIEEYNKNVLLLRSSRKVNIENIVSTASTSSSSVNLSGVENKLQNINNSLSNIKDNLQYTDADDVTKGLAEITNENNASKSVVVETIEKAPFNPYLNDDNNDIYGV